MKELLIDSFKDALFDTVKLIPFLLITYVVMEWLERKTAGRQAHVLGKAEKLGPLIGGVLGIVPQCGFSLMASNLYSGGVIGAGVLIAVFMSTSDEMLPIMLSNDAISAGTIVKILATKAVSRNNRLYSRICAGQTEKAGPGKEDRSSPQTWRT